MRGHYYPSDYARELRLVGTSSTVRTIPSAEEQNARANEIKQAAGQGPQIIVGPDAPFDARDVAAIVQAVALRELLGNLDYHGLSELQDIYPALVGIDAEQIRAAIEEGLK